MKDDRRVQELTVASSSFISDMNDGTKSFLLNIKGGMEYDEAKDNVLSYWKTLKKVNGQYSIVLKDIDKEIKLLEKEMKEEK